MPLVRKVTLTYVQRIQLAPYNHVDAGLVVEVEPDSEDGPDAVRDLAGIIAATWGTVAAATATQVRTAVEEFDLLQEDRRQRLAGAPARSGGGASHAPVEPPLATGRQREAIGALRKSLGWSVAELDGFASRLGVDPARMTAGEAQALLQAMHQQPPRRRALAEPAPPEPEPPFPSAPPAPPAPVSAPPEPEPPFPSAPPAPTAPAPAEPAGEEREPPAAAPGPPQTPAEAEQRFYTRYGEAIGGATLAKVREFLGERSYPRPATVEAWIALAEAVRAKAKASAGGK